MATASGTNTNTLPNSRLSTFSNLFESLRPQSGRLSRET